MSKSRSVRKQLYIILASIVAIQGIMIILTLFFSNVFSLLDSEAIRTFSNITKTRAESINESVVTLITTISEETEEINKNIESIANENDVNAEDLYKYDELYEEVATEINNSLIRILDNSNASDVFVILNGSNSRQDDENYHSAIYLRDSMPDKNYNGDIELLVGPISVAQKLQYPTGSNWKLDINENDSENGFKVYNNPITAAETYPNSEILRYGYWSTPFDFLDDGQEVITYSLPLIDEGGNVYGVIGTGFSINYLAQKYLPTTDLIYDNSFYLMSSSDENNLNLDWFIPGGVLASTYLQKGTSLELEETSNENIHQTELEGLGKMSTYTSDLIMYSENSPFFEESWSLTAMAPTRILNENSNVVSVKLITSILITIGFGFFVVFVFVKIFTRKIVGLSDYISKLSPLDEIHFEQTNLREIDDLTNAIQQLNQNLIVKNKTTSKLLELSLLPIGGYEILNNSKNVILTDYLYLFLGIDRNRIVSVEEWETIYNDLTSQHHPDYENVYRYLNKNDNEEYWLRIKKSHSKDSIIGAIVDVTEDLRENIRLTNQLNYDLLTGLLSKTEFRNRVTKEIQENPNKTGALVFFDLDNLKYINDNFGHDLGDTLIIEAGEIFRYFEMHKGIVSRISGDEFAIYFHGYNDKEQLRNIIDLIKPKSNEYFVKTPNGVENKIRFTGGVAWYPEDGKNVSELLKLADFAMLEAKQKEKGSIYEFDKSYYDKMSYLLENREAINRLIDERRIRFAFQPIVDLNTGEIYAYEALMRPTLDNFKNPYEVLSVASAQAKLPQLEKVLVNLVLEHIATNEETIGDRHIFINLIPNQAINFEEFARLKEIYHRFFSQIVIEIIENDSRDENALIRKVDYLRESGLKIAIDDFGSGYSNEIRILNLLPNIIKIDMELVQGIAKNEDKQSIVNGLVNFCKTKHIKIVAEGIEEYEDLIYLINLGIDYGQGYYLAKPNFDFLELPEELKLEIKNANV